MPDLHHLIGKLAAALLSSLLPWEFSAVKRTESLSRLCSQLSEQEQDNFHFHSALNHNIPEQHIVIRGELFIR